MSIKIMLDAGHYGETFNASPVVKGYYESKQMWILTNKLKKYLEDYGFIVDTTRNNIYTDIELTERGRMSRGYDLFISLHSNAANDENPDSPWLIHFMPDNKTDLDEKSISIAHSLGNVISNIMGVSPPYYYKLGVDFDRDGNGYLDDEYYGVLFGAKSVGTVGIIIEHSFHTNKHSAEWLLDENNLDILAKAEAETIAHYYRKDICEMKDYERRIKELEYRVSKIEENISDSVPKYNWTTACPKDFRPTIHKLLQKKILKGDQNGQLHLSRNMCRILTILDRIGIFDKEV